METDWKEVMMIMLTALEIENGKARNTEKLMKEKIEEWALLQEGGEELQLKVKAVIQDIVWYNVRSSKSLKLFFSDIFGTTILFSIAKTKMMTSLKEISAGVVSDQIKVDEDITSLVFP